MLRVAMSNEPDRDKRQRLEEARMRLLDEHLNPVYLDAAQIDRDAVAPSSARRTTTSSTSGSASGSTSSPRECRALLDETERLWEREGDKLFRARLGIGLAEARPWDVVRLFRAPELDQLYPSDRMLPALEATLARPRHRPALAGERPSRPRARGRASRRARSARRSRCPAR